LNAVNPNTDDVAAPARRPPNSVTASHQTTQHRLKENFIFEK
jgi:hypothetical protein